MSKIRTLLGAVAVIGGLFMLIVTGASAQATTGNGLVSTSISSGTTDEVSARIQAGLAERGLNQVAVVNHSAILAKAVDADLRPTQVILFDDPVADTALLDEYPTFGVDLPQKILVHEAADGSVEITYSSMEHLGARHGVSAGSVALSQAASTLSQLTADAEGQDGSALARTGVGSIGITLVGAALVASGAALLLWGRRQTVVRTSLVVLLFAAVALPVGSFGPQAGADSADGLVTIDSEFDVETTIENVRTEAEARDFKVALTITHTTGGAPIRLITFGRPDLNVELLSANQTVGLDLPQKMLVWEDIDGVHITYNDESYIAERHGITSKGSVVQELESLFEEIAVAAGTS